jgi:predicted nucleotidyltransferase
VTGEPSIGYLEELLRTLTDGGVRFVVAGGVAVVLHGIERTTMDLDIALELSPENVSLFRDAMDALGLRPLVPVPIDALSDPEMVRVMVEEKHAIVFMLADPRMPLRKVDVFLTEQLSYGNLSADSVPVEIPGIPLRIVSLERLLALKRAVDPPRDKDLFDIRAIERRLREGASRE